MQDNDHNTDDELPSKSQLKRDADALKRLGETITRLNHDQIDSLPLSEDLHDAIYTYQRIKQHGGRKRQLQYIGKLMRSSDADAIQAEVDKILNVSVLETARLHRIESMRDALIQQGDAALGEVLSNYPQADRQHLRQLMRNANHELKANKPPRSSRELFRYLRDLDDAAHDKD